MFFMDESLASAFEPLFRSLNCEDRELLSPFELNGLSYYQNIQIQPGSLQWLSNHFDTSDNLFRHNDFEICPLFKEIPAVPRLDIDLASPILPVFGFTAYEIPYYDFGADVVPLRLLADRALGMDCNSPYWPLLVCFCIISQYLLFSDIDGYGSLKLVLIIEQMARQRTCSPLILAETFTWLGEHAWDSSSVLGPIGSLLLLQLWALEKLQVMAPPSNHLIFDFRPRVYVRCQRHLIGKTLEDWTAIFQDLTFEGVRWNCP
ncbi:hypothetical protein JCGZ_03794 [Jatropha curcas]|uniref:Uncharacterized protein n=1 Tax=Jatropha curcas TaxID=180498 RepID=A0A067L172_JATCU|nr:hypothetical protein JCGZ_03794 [Jatropha curcas]